MQRCSWHSYMLQAQRIIFKQRIRGRRSFIRMTPYSLTKSSSLGSELWDLQYRRGDVIDRLEVRYVRCRCNCAAARVGEPDTGRSPTAVSACFPLIECPLSGIPDIRSEPPQNFTRVFHGQFSANQGLAQRVFRYLSASAGFQRLSGWNI